MKRLQHREELKKPAITAQIYLHLPFSISANAKDSDNFAIACKNDYSNKSQIFKKILYKLMKVKNDAEFQKVMKKSVKFSKQEIYNIVGIGEGDFSKKVMQEIADYTKKNEAKNEETKTA
jgi:hypothetical protein